MFESFLSVCSATVFVVRSGSEEDCVCCETPEFCPAVTRGFFTPESNRDSSDAAVGEITILSY